MPKSGFTGLTVSIALKQRLNETAKASGFPSVPALLESLLAGTSTRNSTSGVQTGYVMRLKKEFEWFTTEEFRKMWRIKLSDIIKPTEELTQKEMKEAQQEAQSLMPHLKMFMRRTRRHKRSNTEQDR